MASQLVRVLKNWPLNGAYRMAVTNTIVCPNWWRWILENAIFTIFIDSFINLCKMVLTEAPWPQNQSINGAMLVISRRPIILECTWYFHNPLMVFTEWLSEISIGFLKMLFLPFSLTHSFNNLCKMVLKEVPLQSN